MPFGMSEQDIMKSATMSHLWSRISNYFSYIRSFCNTKANGQKMNGSLFISRPDQ